MTINGISYEDAHPGIDPDEPEPYHCTGNTEDDCESCQRGDCGIRDGHCWHYEPEADEDYDTAEDDCVHCGCCICLSCEYAKVA